MLFSNSVLLIFVENAFNTRVIQSAWNVCRCTYLKLPTPIRLRHMHSNQPILLGADHRGEPNFATPVFNIPLGRFKRLRQRFVRIIMHIPLPLTYKCFHCFSAVITL